MKKQIFPDLSRSIRRLFFLIILFAMTIPVYSQKTGTQQPSEFKPSGRVWGYTFGDYFWKLHADSLGRGNTQYSGLARDYDAFQFRRIYLGYDYDISEHFSASVLLAYEGNTDVQGERTVFIKAANIRWKNFIHNNDLVLGQSSTPFFATMSESVWGYRSIEKTITDMRKICSSNDVGIAWIGKVNDKGDYGYNFMLANGTAQKPETDKYKKVYGELYARFMDQKFIIDMAGTYEKASTKQSKTAIKGFVAYQSDPVTVGVEVFSQTQKAAAMDTTAGTENAKDVNIIPFGLSVFVRGQIIANKLNYFARYDNYNPDTDYNANILYSSGGFSDKENFITAGFDWMPIKNVHLMPNIWYNSYGSMKNNVSGKVKNDYDMVARITFYYIYK